jgi:ATP-dependent Clp protease ATP-binding subunit ClpA
MYERFSDRGRKVMQLANQEAQRFNHEYIGTEHILLALIKEGAGVAANVLNNLDIDLRKVRLEVEKIVQSGPDMVKMGRLPQTPRAKKVVEYAIEEARNLNHNYVGTEHLLLGLLREQEGIGAQVLINLGLDLETVREEVLNLLGTPAGERPADRPALGPRTPALLQEVDVRIEQLTQEKAAAVAAGDFERAAVLRDQIDRIKKQRNERTRAVRPADPARLLAVSEELKQKIVGQDEAVEAVLRVVCRSCAGLTDSRRPLGSFLFAGPPGVGKTLLARRLAEALYGGEDALLQVDMAAFAEKADAARFLVLLEGRQPEAPESASSFSGVVLLERVEQAHPAVAGVLACLLETGTFAIDRRRVVHLRNSVVVLTAGAGGAEAARQRAYGLSPRRADDPTAREEAKDRLRADLEKAFGPEFVARLDEVVVFRGLSRDDLPRVAALELEAVARRLQARGLTLDVTDEARAFLVEKGADVGQGARPLVRAVERRLGDPLAERLLRGEFGAGQTLTVGVRVADGEKELTFTASAAPGA